MNIVVFSGRLGIDPEITKTQTGFTVMRLSVGLSKKMKNEFKTHWIPVTVFGETAERLRGNLMKGQGVVVHGELDASSYQDREGNKKKDFKVIARDVKVLLPKRQQEEAPEPQSSSMDSDSWGFDEDIPF